MRQIRWAIGFGVAAALAAAFGAAIFAVWGEDGERTGTAAAARTLRDARVLVWIGFAVAAGFVLAGRDRLTSEVDRIFEEDRRVWDRRVLGERETPAGSIPGSDRPLASDNRPDAGPLPDLEPGYGGAATDETGGASRPALYVDAARTGPLGRLLTAGGVLLGAGTGAGLGALVGELATGAVLGVVAGLLVGLLLARGEG